MSLDATFKQYFDTYQSMVYTLCLGYVKGDGAQAEDLTQEVFAKVWVALPGFQERASAKTWIYRICVNTCLLHLRKEKKQVIERLAEGHQQAAEDATTDPTYSVLYRAIGELNPLDRMIILLVLEEVTYPEIAQIVGVTENNLRVKISRIKQKLNTLLSPQENGI